MRSRYLIVGLALLAGGIASAGLVVSWRAGNPDRPPDRPTRHLPAHPAHTDHKTLIKGPFAATDGSAVTRECLSCHPNAAHEVMATSHWTWKGHEVTIPGHDKPQRIGKLNLINNFCIGVEPNLAGCTSCHAGYGWKDANFDFSKPENVDCLVCHENTGAYKKANVAGGLPDKSVDLLAAAKSVGSPTRRNCGYCHFAGGGGDAVKHGDMDGTMYFPTQRIDAHMGKYNLLCQDCHRTEHHAVSGRSMSVSVDNANRIRCTDCHSPAPHREDRLNMHTKAVACQTCHIPEMAVESPTKMTWDWSTAGQDRPNADPHEYLKIKGSFTYAREVTPEYAWYNGHAERYLKGDKIDPSKSTRINYPVGSARDPEARIWPFKVHRGKQIYDTEYKYLLIPKTFGDGGYWKEFNWDKALRLGSETSGLKYSGKYDFAPTEMWWPLSHMVSTKDKALQCTDCHSETGRMSWSALGYDGDPAFRGGRTPQLTKEGRP